MSLKLGQDPALYRDPPLFGDVHGIAAIWIENSDKQIEELRICLKIQQKQDDKPVVEYCSKVKLVPTLLSWLDG